MLEDALLEVAQEDRYGKTEIANAGEVLRVLWGEVGAEAFEEWVGVTSKANGQNPQPGDPCPTLHNDSRNYLVGPVVECYGGNGVAHTLDASYWKGAGARNGKEREFVAVAGKPPRKYIIRRLTPLECCRLQGFPDWWEDGVQGSDSARYKMWGNGIALPNAEYVIGCAKELIEGKLPEVEE